MRWLAVPLVALTLALPRAGRAQDFMPLEEVRPGMTGVGRTVFEGSRIEEFKVEVIGVLDNVGPRQSVVLARLLGGPLANTGVIAGMSGSPVFIDGRLLGAVAYGFPFSKETIAGITPIREMIEATRTAAPRSASARLSVPARAAALGLPLEREALAAALARPLEASTRSLPVPQGLGPGLAGGSLTPLALPLVFSGFTPEAFDWAQGIFAGQGFRPVMGTAGTSRLGPLPDLEPGAPVGISLVEGDLDVSATGTVTWVDRDHVYAFGHPFYNLGPTQFPMRKAYVYSVFPSLYQSWKISSPGDPVGTFEQDRTTGIAGRTGPSPRMIPVQVHLATSRGQERDYAFRVVDDELFTPALAYMAMASIIQGSERTYGTASIGVDATLTLQGGRTLRLQDLFAEQQPAVQAAALVAAPLAALLANDFAPVRVEGIEVRLTAHETEQTATLQRAWLEKGGRVHPGDTVALKLLLRTYRGESRVETVALSVPANAPAGAYSVLVADGPALTALEQRETRQLLAPRDLEQLLRLIGTLRHRDHLYVRLLRPDVGAVVGGEALPSLPPSVMAVLGGSEQGPALAPLRTATVWEQAVATGFAVSGTRTLTLTVER